MLDALRPFLAALLVLPLRAFAGWLAARGYSEITGEQISKAVEALLIWILPILSTLGVLARRLVDKKANPHNAASTHAALEGKQKQRARKLARKHRKIDELVATPVDNDDDIPPLATIRGPLNQFRPPGE